MSEHISKINVHFKVTPLATWHMAKYFEDKEISPVRIFFHSSG